MNAYYKGKIILGSRGPAGPDGNPIGTIISFMGTSAPDDYLVCDGSEYNIVDYSDLAKFFEKEFGSSNYFGGDGATTFAVPDMRNLFLRGYHGESDERLSGEVGERQESTQHNGIYAEASYVVIPHVSPPGIPLNVDTIVDRAVYVAITSGGDPSGSEISRYTSRPVNMAVLYCIKAVKSFPTEQIYSTEETRIGTWIDGKPLYRNIINSTIQFVNGAMGNFIPFASDIFELTQLRGIVGPTPWGVTYAVPFAEGNMTIGLVLDNGRINVSTVWGGNHFNIPATIILEYTKTTD